jgi:molybdate transport system substrate-binding protein
LARANSGDDQGVGEERETKSGPTTGKSPGSRFVLVGLAIVVSIVEHDLFGKPLHTFPDHALIRKSREEIMDRRSLMTRVAAALGALMLSGAIGHAAEVKVLTSVALKSVLDELSPVFEKKTGNKLVIDYGLAADQKKRVLDGERADVIIVTRAMMEDLVKQKKVADGLVNVAGTPVAVAARAGAAKPDISTVEAFKQALLSIKSLAYSDPAKGGLSGVVAARAIERLGIAEPMKSKTILVAGALSPELVARGEAELGIAQASEIVPIAGAQLVGPLPGELAVMTLFTGGIGAESQSVAAAKALIEFLTGPEAAANFKAKGFEAG